MEDEDFQRFAFVARQLWFRQNKAIFYDEFLSPVQVNQIATDQLETYKKAESEQRSHSAASTSTGVPRWQRPTAGLIKINWDVATASSGDLMEIGVVARDHDGNVVGVKCCTRPYISDPAIAEAVGAWEAVLFGW